MMIIAAASNPPTSWGNLTPWVLAMAGAFTLGRGAAKILDESSRERVKRLAHRLDAATDFCTALVAIVGFSLWVTQYAGGWKYVVLLAPECSAVVFFVVSLMYLSRGETPLARGILQRWAILRERYSTKLASSSGYGEADPPAGPARTTSAEHSATKSADDSRSEKNDTQP